MSSLDKTRSEKAPTICAVIVTWMPDIDRLQKVLFGLTRQVDAVVVIDNGSPTTLFKALSRRDYGFPLEFERFSNNKGLAAGQNRGIAWADERNFSHVILLDQDSIPFPCMVADLLNAERELIHSGAQVGAVGPLCMDQRTGRSLPFCQITPLGTVTKIYGSKNVAGAPCCRADFLISSGSLLRLCVISRVGAMDEALFIDSIDIEWSYRAASFGYLCFGVFSARLDHRLGDTVVSFFKGRFQWPVHGGSRLKSMMRNRVVLYKRPYIPRRWKRADFPRLVGKFLLFSLFVPPRWEHCKSMWRGLLAGFHGEVLKRD